MKKRFVCIILFLTLLLCSMTQAFAKAKEKKIEEPENLYAQSAVLMDADSGRILFAKNGQEERAMASTTKIMTCILALELGKPEEQMTVSQNAAVQPKVKLGAKEGQKFYLKDLLYSLMLESHNDTAVIIAENIAGSVEDFAVLMNRKARELGCQNTYFITPNGLDARDEKGIHHTTAEDLAVIMRYCIMDSPKAAEFIDITQVKSYKFTDCGGNGSYHCSNHNAFLNMMEGALSGKTGFTADAGYCYVGALSDGKRTFIVALLACGWPNNKSYKWSDTRKLMTYGLENYEYKNVWKDLKNKKIVVEDGVTEQSIPGETLTAQVDIGKKDYFVLLRNDEEVQTEFKIPDSLSAPVRKGSVVGTVVYSIGEEKIGEFNITATETVEKRSMRWSVGYIWKQYFLNEHRKIKINQYK